MVLVIHSIPEEATVQITDMTPAEIDTELARLWGETATLRSYAMSAARSAARYGFAPGDRRQVGVQTELAEYRVRGAALRAEALPFEQEFTRRGGWNRYYLVTSSVGHVHREMTCSTCFSSTEFGWLPELSDCDEAAMITEFGEKACTVCFPDAPANPAFHAPGRRDAEALAARNAEKATKDAAKAAKAITAPDGSPLRGEYGVIRTKVAARNELSQAVQSHAWYGPTHPTGFAATAQRMAEALAAAGIDPLPIAERAATKAAKEGATYGAPHLLVTWEVAA